MKPVSFAWSYDGKRFLNVNGFGIPSDKMNTRQPLQPSNTPIVLSVSFSTNKSRFTAATSEGIRCFRSDNCLTTYQPALSSDGGVAIAEALDDRYIAFVGGGRAPAYKPNMIIWWDAVLGTELHRLDFHEPVIGLRLNGRWLVVVLHERVVVFHYQEMARTQEPTPPLDDAVSSKEERLRAPNMAGSLHRTDQNEHALAALRGDLLVLPSQTLGQVQLIPLNGGSKRVLPAHKNTVACLALSDDSTLLATASEQGTLIRIWRTKTLEQIAEFRRGVDPARILGLAFSPGNRWLASTSDKGTIHIFDLKPPDPATVEAAGVQQRQNRKSQSYASHRLSGTSTNEAQSSISGGGRSSPASGTYQGSVQEYYGLRPVPISASPPAGSGSGVSALAALKAAPWAPKVLKDIKSVAKATFSMGEDPPHWQGGAGFYWTTGPDGRKRKVNNPVLPLPSDPAGKPPKGVVAFKPRAQKIGQGEKQSPAAGQEAMAADADNDGATLYVIGGGSDARWEQFDLLPATDGLGGYGLVYRGFRRYLTKQFAD
ncbi:WD40 repeat-like protein [Teratosphaeria nubilosa]|uniref:WD40 repeat-like protein n=1 Tax=Teratosphaeria nubilosa TaxID=161662 RepID=A0A6G1L632_9PEZI|nr:WD40 repeat-like protein [Teratosphaeria nubilosa]